LFSFFTLVMKKPKRMAKKIIDNISLVTKASKILLGIISIRISLKLFCFSSRPITISEKFRSAPTPGLNKLTRNKPVKMAKREVVI